MRHALRDALSDAAGFRDFRTVQALAQLPVCHAALVRCMVEHADLLTDVLPHLPPARTPYGATELLVAPQPTCQRPLLET